VRFGGYSHGPILENKIVRTVGKTGLGKGKSPGQTNGQKPLPKIENKMAPGVASVRIGVVSVNGRMAYVSKKA